MGVGSLPVPSGSNLTLVAAAAAKAAGALPRPRPEADVARVAEAWEADDASATREAVYRRRNLMGAGRISLPLIKILDKAIIKIAAVPIAGVSLLGMYPRNISAYASIPPA